MSQINKKKTKLFNSGKSHEIYTYSKKLQKVMTKTKFVKISIWSSLYDTAQSYKIIVNYLSLFILSHDIVEIFLLSDDKNDYSKFYYKRFQLKVIFWIKLEAHVSLYRSPDINKPS